MVADYHNIPDYKMLSDGFFNRDTLDVAKDLIGKVLFHRYGDQWLSAMIIETEAYCIDDKASHSSLGYTEKRSALFKEPGTLYLYYARGGDSLCIGTAGEGNAVLIKSGIVYPDTDKPNHMTVVMNRLNPPLRGGQRPVDKLCSGQTLICRSLDIKVKDWDGKGFDRDLFYAADVGYTPEALIQTTRLGIRADRDAHLPYRFIDNSYSHRCTRDILTQKKKKEGDDYHMLFR